MPGAHALKRDLQRDIRAGLQSSTGGRHSGDAGFLTGVASHCLHPVEVAPSNRTAFAATVQCKSGVTARSAKARMERTLLVDPDSFNMRCNFACAPSVHLGAKQAAMDMLGQPFESI